MATLNLNVDPTGMETGAAKGKRALDGVARSARKTDRELDKMSRNSSRSMSKLGNSTGALGTKFKALGVAAAAMAVVMATKATKSFLQFDTALSEVSTLIKGTTQEMVALRNGAIDLNQQFGATATAQVQAYYQAISAGVGDVSDASKFLVTANKLAVGGVSDLVKSVDVLTTAVNSYASSNLTAADAADTLFQGVKLGKTTIDELASAMGKVTPISAALGISLSDTVAAVAAITSSGKTTSEAVTGLTRAFSNILKPAKKAQNAAREMGLDFSVAALQSQGLSGFLQSISIAAGGSQEAMAKLFRSTEALTTVLTLVSDDSKLLNDNLLAMEGRTGAAQEAFDKIADSVGFRLNIELATLKNRFLGVGEALSETFVSALKVLNTTFDTAAAAGKQLNIAFVGIGVGISSVALALAGPSGALVRMTALVLGTTVAYKGTIIATGGVIKFATSLVKLGSYMGLTYAQLIRLSKATYILNAILLTTRATFILIAGLLVGIAVGIGTLVYLFATAETATDKLKKSTDLLVDSIKEEVTQSNILRLELEQDSIKTTVAINKLEEAKARLVNVQAIQAEVLATTLASDAYKNLQSSIRDEQSRVSSISATGNDDNIAAKLKDSLEEAQLSLVGLRKEQAALVEVNPKVNSAISNIEDNIKDLTKAIGLSTGAYITFNSEVDKSKFAGSLQGVGRSRSGTSGGSTVNATQRIGDRVKAYNQLRDATYPLEKASRDLAAAQRVVLIEYASGRIGLQEYRTTLRDVTDSFRSSLDDLVNSLDPAKDASMRFSTGLSLVDHALENGLITMKEAVTVANQLGVAMGKLSDVSGIAGAFNSLRTRLDPKFAAQQRLNSANSTIDDYLSTDGLGIKDRNAAIALRADAQKAYENSINRLNTTGTTPLSTTVVPIKTDPLEEFARLRGQANTGVKQAQEIDVVRTAVQAAKDEFALLAAEVSNGTELISQFNHEADGVGKKLENDINGATAAFEKAGAASANFFYEVSKGGDRARSVIKQVADDFADKLLRQGFLSLLGGAIGAAGGPGSTAGKVFSTIFSANGNAFDNGNVLAFANGGVVDRPISFGLSGNRRGIAGEAGPEAILPLSRGPNGKLGVQTDGGGKASGDVYVSVSYNVDARGTNNEAIERMELVLQKQSALSKSQIIGTIKQAKKDRIL